MQNKNEHEKTTADSLELIAETAHLRFVKNNGWSYVERVNVTGVVCVIAVTPENKILLVEQYREPVRSRVIELPSGLSGDIAGQADEPLEQAAQRELIEETGYQAGTLQQITTVTTSAGMTNEIATYFLADQLKKVGPGGGDSSENITVHEIEIEEIDNWLARAQKAEKKIAARVYGGLYLLQKSID